MDKSTYQSSYDSNMSEKQDISIFPSVNGQHKVRGKARQGLVQAVKELVECRDLLEYL